MGENGGQQRIRSASGRHLRVAPCLLVLASLLRVHGQDFVLTLTNTPDPILFGSNIVYSLSVSNATGLNLNPGQITSVYNSNAEFVRATNQFGYTSSVGQVVFPIPADAFPANAVIDVLLELRGTNVGLLTNTFTMAINDGGQTTPASTNVVSSIVPPRADLGILVIGPANGVFPGDRFSYRLLATNGGPDAVNGVTVSNPVPANVNQVVPSPSNQVQVTNGFVLFSVGTLTNQGSAVATVSVLATNAAATNLISATISAPAVTDTNTANNSATSNVPVLTPVLDQIVVTNVSAQAFNQQTGWIEQRVGLVNVSTSAVDSVRLLVSGLTNELVRLVNATGTNWSTPYVAQGSGLGPGDQLELTLEYYSPTRNTNGPNPVWSAYGTPQLDLTPQDGVGITVDRIVQIDYTNAPNVNNGRILLEWPATSGAQYQVIYDEQADFSSAKGSMPLVPVPDMANRVQWLDYGPPRTLTAPSNTASRFYKVVELP